LAQIFIRIKLNQSTEIASDNTGKNLIQKARNEPSDNAADEGQSSASCANCSTPLSGKFCVNCGQSAKSHRGPIWQASYELTEEFLALDSKMVQSLLTLLFKPGVLTAKFISGKRASVLPPVRLYLVISLLFFFVFEIPTQDVSKANVYIGNTLLGKEEPTKGMPNFNIMSSGFEESLIDTWFEQTFADTIEVMKTTNAQITVNNIFKRLENILPNALILFFLLFALVLKALYLFKRVLYFDHLIFSLHFQTWLMGSVLIIYGLALQNPWWSALAIVIPIYLAKAQKVVYAQSYWLVIPKTIAIVFIYLFLIFVAGLVSLFSSIVLL
jgi:hypothetical protein